MQILNIKDLTVSFGPTPLFQSINLQVHTGERIALVGRNGVGKSTLLKIISGEALHDSGAVQFSNNSSVAMLSQTVPTQLDGTVYDVIASGLKNVDEYERWKYEIIIQDIIAKLELNPAQIANTLSGGLKRRALLGRALASEPDILLLDEPTNHLDMESIVWLEQFLKNYSKTIIFITHDRQFMSNLATRIIEIDYQNLFSWPGNYAHYCKLKLELISAQEKEQALFDKRLSEEEVWIRQGVKARRTRNEGRVRRLEAMREEKSRQFKQQGQSKIQIQSDTKSGKIVFDIDNISFSYPNKKVIDRFSAIVARGDHVGIVGQNGAGKSTLIKLLLGELSPNAGDITRGTNLEIAYFDQHRMELDEKQSVQDNVAQGSDNVVIDGKNKHVIGYLQDFLFSPDRARVKVSLLSGGEKNRLLLAKLFARPANLIIMDEPTNDLDIETLELLEEKLTDFPGTLIIISHDRTFLNNVATQLWVMDNNGHIQEYVGGHINWDAVIPKKSAAITAEKNEVVAAVKNHSTKITAEEKRELNSLPKKITQLENTISKLHATMAEPDFYQQDKEKIAAHTQKVIDAEKQLEQLYARWQELEDK